MDDTFVINAGGLLRELINEHPDSYVKVGNKYIPTLIKLFNLEFIRHKKEIIDDDRFKTETYQDLPIIFTCDVEEEYSFNYLYNQLTFGPEYLHIDEDKIEGYIGLVARLANTNEFKVLLSGINKTVSFYLSLAKYEINLEQLFNEVERINACNLIYKQQLNNIDFDIEYREYNTEIKQCKFGKRCKYLKNGKCKFGHPGVAIYNHIKGIGALDIESWGAGELRTKLLITIDIIRNSLRSYGFIFIATTDEYNLLANSIYGEFPNTEFRIYRPSTKKIHEIINYNKYNIFNNNKPLMIKEEEGKDYDYESECKKELRDYSKVYKMCIPWSDWKVIIDGKLETLKLIRIFVPYKCGYKCDTIFEHRHGN